MCGLKYQESVINQCGCGLALTTTTRGFFGLLNANQTTNKTEIRNETLKQSGEHY